MAGEQVNGSGAHRWFVGTLTLKSQFSEFRQFRQLKVEHLEDDLIHLVTPNLRKARISSTWAALGSLGP